ncbi:MAG: tyrosine-type recombinase/integrase [Sarcina sp.]
MLGVYRFKNLVGEIIYIGKSKNISSRQKQHFGKDGHLPDECYSETAYIEIAELKNQTEMEMYEIYLINKHAPKYNIRYNHNEFNISIELPKLKWVQYNPYFLNDKKFQSTELTNVKNDFSIRAATSFEINTIIKILYNGLKYVDDSKKKRRIESNKQIALILSIQATTGLKINEVLKLKLENIKNNSLLLINIKNETQYSKILPNNLIAKIQEYIQSQPLQHNEFLFDTTPRNVQLRLKKVVEHLKYNNISTDSFRKFYAHEAYKKSNHNLEFVRKLLNHSSVAITQRYLESSEKDINQYSSNINLFKDTSEVN